MWGREDGVCERGEVAKGGYLRTSLQAMQVGDSKRQVPPGPDCFSNKAVNLSIGHSQKGRMAAFRCWHPHPWAYKSFIRTEQSLLTEHD